MSLQDEKMRVKYGLHFIHQEAPACSGAVRLEQCECRTAGERGGVPFVLGDGTGQPGQVGVRPKLM